MVEDMRSEIRDAYSRRAAEYAAHLRSMEAVHPADQQLVDTWADQIDGPATGAVGGVLAWYSLIHCEPDEIQVPLREFARVLRPGSDLLIGFFDGPRVKKFEHTVVAAHRWPVAGGRAVRQAARGGLRCDRDAPENRATAPALRSDTRAALGLTVTLPWTSTPISTRSGSADSSCVRLAPTEWFSSRPIWWLHGRL